MNEQGTQALASFENGEIKALPAEQVMLLSQQIATLVQLSNFIQATQYGKNAENGVMMIVQLNDNSQTRLHINSKLLVGQLIAEFDNLGKELEEKGIDLGSLLMQTKDRFDTIYPQQNPQS